MLMRSELILQKMKTYVSVISGSKPDLNPDPARLRDAVARNGIELDKSHGIDEVSATEAAMWAGIFFTPNGYNPLKRLIPKK